MTDLQRMYLNVRGAGKLGHYATLREMARRTTIDPDSIGRCLDRAREADAIDARRARRAARKADRKPVAA